MALEVEVLTKIIFLIVNKELKNSVQFENCNFESGIIVSVRFFSAIKNNLIDIKHICFTEQKMCYYSSIFTYFRFYELISYENQNNLHFHGMIYSFYARATIFI